MKRSNIGWTGETSRWIGSNGYVHVRINGQTYLEHRLVLEEKLGRPLTENEIGHHLNSNKLDNRPENLEAVTRPCHVRVHRPGYGLRPIGAPNEKVPCACGCGETIERWDSKNRERKFVSGHNQRGHRWTWAHHRQVTESVT